MRDETGTYQMPLLICDRAPEYERLLHPVQAVVAGHRPVQVLLDAVVHSTTS